MGQRISLSDPVSPAEDFDALFSEALKAAQDLSGAVWTDYNTHDPGVTILEAVCYALTDLGYRTEHPMADLLASSMAATGVRVDDQPLFTGDRILISAPVTPQDLSRLIFASVEGVARADVVPRGAQAHVFDVDVLLYPSVIEQLEDPQPVLDRIEAQICQILQRHRAWGWRIGSVVFVDTETPATPAAFAGASDLSMRAEALEGVLDGRTRVRNIGAMLKAGVPPDQIFDGPATSSLVSDPDTDAGGASGLSMVPTVFGVVQDPSEDGSDLDRTLGVIEARDTAHRWSALYAVNTLTAEGYATLPMGRPDRALGRYVSLQHLFPDIYGLGRLGPNRGGPERRAEVRQLKGYLCFFEQIIANQLSQLENLARLFSIAETRQSYFSQPLAHDPPMPGDAPFIDAVLGAETDPEGWLDAHVTRLAQITAERDPGPERLQRAADHMLARFGESVLPHPDKPMDLARRHAFLSEIDTLGRDRGVAHAPHTAACAPAIRRAHLISGDTPDTLVIEHAQLDLPFTSGPVIHAVTLRIAEAMDSDARADPEAQSTALTGVLTRACPKALWMATQAQISAALQSNGAWRVIGQAGYGAALHLALPGGGDVQIAQRFASHARARRARARLAAPGTEILPCRLIEKGFSNGLTVLGVAAEDVDKARFAACLRQALPAHLPVVQHWVSRNQFVHLKALYEASLRGASTPVSLVDELEALSVAAFLAERAAA